MHKLRIVLKELRESRCWLRLIEMSELLPDDEEFSWLLDESTQL
ncbi:TPA: four helix bundle protein [Candidatus Poribacteria bacterium]|nr:four helix bundle protein [Candidatus Poribacteria bacterium]